MQKILLIDDCEEIGALIKSTLTTYFVQQAKTVSGAIEHLQEGHVYNLLIIDISLPDGNGFDLCAKLTNDVRYDKIPKILLTAQSQTAEKVYGFSCGADDYVTKPCNMVELKARIDRYLQRKEDLTGSILSRPPFELHIEFQKCYLLDEKQQKVDAKLTPTEFRLLLALVRSEGRVLTRHDLGHFIWKTQGVTIEPRGIDTHVAHLRSKLKSYKNMIVSVYGSGYSFTRDQAA